MCGNDVNWYFVIEEDAFQHIFYNVDRHGVECLTENKQLVYQGRICSENCFDVLEERYK
jgi:hypothetical protein